MVVYKDYKGLRASREQAGTDELLQDLRSEVDSRLEQAPAAPFCTSAAMVSDLLTSRLQLNLQPPILQACVLCWSQKNLIEERPELGIRERNLTDIRV